MALGHLLLDLVDGVHDRRVVTAAERLGDARVAEVGELAHHVHADLAGGDERPAPALAAEVVDRPAEHLGGLVEDQLGGDHAGRGGREEVGEHLLGDLLGELGAVEAGVGGDPDQRALELADVVADVGGDERQHLGRDAAEVLGLGLLAEDGEAGLELGRLDVGDEAPLEAGAEAVLEAGDRLRRPVGRDDDLAALAVELVERVEELLLELLGALEELDVVDEQHVEVAVAALEARHRPWRGWRRRTRS